MTLTADHAIDIYIYTCLVQQMEAYSYSFNGHVSFETKHRLNQVQKEAKHLMKLLEKHCDMEELANDAEVFDRVLRKIREAKGEKKQQLYALMVAWSNDEVKIEE